MTETLYSYVSDHPIHVPHSNENPWNVEVYDSKGYIIKSNRGVFQVYENSDKVDLNEPKDYQYPLLETYISDLNKVCMMMADGPL